MSIHASTDWLASQEGARVGRHTSSTLVPSHVSEGQKITGNAINQTIIHAPMVFIDLRFFVGLLTLVEWEVGRPGSSDSPCHVSNLPSPDPRWKHPLFFEECLFPQSLGAFCFNISSIGGCFHWPKTSTNRNHHFPSIFHQFFWLSKSSVRSWGVKGIDFGLGEFWGETLGSWIFL